VKVGRNDPCPCGSGQKFKRCHGSATRAVSPSTAVLARAEIPKTSPQEAKSLSIDALGIPGAKYQLWSAFTKKGEKPQFPNQPLIDKYQVAVTLTRDLTDERASLSFGGPEGDSFIRVPAGGQLELTIFSARTTTAGTQKVEIGTLANKQERLAKCRVELEASSFKDAEHTAFDSISPLLSSVAFESDVPIRVAQLDVKQTSTGRASMTYTCPYPDASLPPAESLSTAPYIQSLMSLYCEGINSNSQNYQFLCWYKIIEGIYWKRDDERAAKPKGSRRDPTPKIPELVPDGREELRRSISSIFPTVGTKGLTDGRWDGSIPDEVLGWKFGHIRQDHLEPMRNKIAHMLSEPSGDLSLSPDTRAHMVEVTKWITLLRFMARVMIQNEKARIPGPPGLGPVLSGAKTIDEMRQRFSKA
jgi:hypothetical protein